MVWSIQRLSSQRSRSPVGVAQLWIVRRLTPMKRYMTHILAIAALVLVSCSKTQPPNLPPGLPPPPGFVGRWHEVGSSGEYTFHKDSTVEFSSPGLEVSGKYSFITDTQLKIELERTMPHDYQVALSGDKMTLTDIIDGQKIDYLKEQ